MLCGAECILVENSITIPGEHPERLLGLARTTGAYLVTGAHERLGGTLHKPMIYIDAAAGISRYIASWYPPIPSAWCGEVADEAAELLEAIPGEEADLILTGGSAVIDQDSHYVQGPVLDRACILYAEVRPDRRR